MRIKYIMTSIDNNNINIMPAAYITETKLLNYVIINYNSIVNYYKGQENLKCIGIKIK